MNNVFVYCETEGTKVAEVSQELLTKGRKLADTLGVQLHAVAAGEGITGKVEDQILPYGVDKLFIFDAPGLFPYTSAPHTDMRPLQDRDSKRNKSHKWQKTSPTPSCSPMLH